MSKSRAFQLGVLGCGAVAFVIVGLAVIIAALNWPKVSEVYQQAKSAVSEMIQVSNALQHKYGGRVVVTVRRQPAAEGAVLRVALSNPTFLDHVDPDGPVAKEKALEVAAAARDTLGPQSRYEKYEVVFSRDSGTGITFSRSWAFSFRATELPATTDSR